MQQPLINLFTPMLADEAHSNPQDISVREIVARLDPEQFTICMVHGGASIDPRLAARPNTCFYRWTRHFNSPRMLRKLLRDHGAIFFYPRVDVFTASFLHLKRALRLRTPVVVHVTWDPGLEFAPAATAQRIRRVQRLLFHQAAVVAGNSTFVSRRIHGLYGIESVTVHNGIDSRYFYPPPDPRERTGRLRVLYAGAFRPWKRVPVAVRLAAEFPNVTFAFAGKGQEEALCHRLAGELQLTNVQFLGHLPSQQLGEAMRNSDLFLFPSISEGHPQVLGQAATCGLPCICMAHYQPDYVVDGNTGLLAKDDVQLRAHLQTLIANAEAREQMGRAARQHARLFNWDMITRRWAEILQNVAGGLR